MNAKEQSVHYPCLVAIFLGRIQDAVDQLASELVKVLIASRLLISPTKRDDALCELFGGAPTLERVHLNFTAEPGLQPLHGLNARGHGQRVAAQSAGLIHGPSRSHHLHDVLELRLLATTNGPKDPTQQHA